MACVTECHLENAISPGLIPPYIVAACLFFHLNITKGEFLNINKKLVIIKHYYK